MLKFMLDTNILIYTIKNKPQEVRESFKLHADQMCISSVAYGELIYGAEHSAFPERDLEVIESMAARLEVLPFDTNDASHFGQLRAELASTGNIIGPYDLMIAGHARSKGLILVTNNEKEFNRVQGLRVVNWVRKK